MAISRRNFMVGTGAAAILANLPGASIVYADGKKILRARMERDMQVLDPAYMIGQDEVSVQVAINPRLADVEQVDGVYKAVPTEFVTKLEQVDDTTIAFELKPGFQWTNGFGELTAEDVKYSLERMLESDYKGSWGTMTGVEITGTYSGNIKLSAPYPAIWLVALSSGVGCLVCKAATESVGGKYTTEVPASCGPYVIEEWLPDQLLTLTKNPDWKGSTPEFDTVEFILISDDAASDLAYEAGEVDVAKVNANTLQRYTETPVDGTKIAVAGYTQYMWMGMNTDHPKLQDIRVRKAIQRAVDADSVAEAAYFGVAPKSNGILPPGILGSRKAASYKHDMAEAKKLMAESGVTGLELDLITLNQPARIIAGQIIQANLAEIGITVKLIPVDAGPFWSLGREQKGDAWKDSQLWLMRFGGSLDPADYAQWFVKGQIGNWNWERWSDDEFEALYQEGNVTTDTAKRTEIYSRMQEIMDNTGAYVWLVHEPEAFLHRSDLEPSLSPEGQFSFQHFKNA